MMEFCKDFNAKTTAFKASATMRVKLVAFEDKTFKYTLFAPPTSWYLKRVTGIAKGSGSPGTVSVGQVSLKAIYEIALSKQAHDSAFTGLPLESICKTICASAKAMGLKVVK